MTDGKVKFSFSVNKTQNGKPNRNSNIFKDDMPKDDKGDIEYIREINEKAIKSVNPAKKEGDVIIPLIQSKKPILDKIKVKAEPKDPLLSVTDSLKREAMEKIMAESKQELSGDAVSSLVIPMTAETENQPIVSEIVEEEVPDADYAEVAVESFGLAMLRGMGSADEIATRLTAASAIPTRRPRGLGLGAQIDKESAANVNTGTVESGEEALVLKPGVRCCILQGRNCGRYATVDSIDGNQDRVVLSMATGGRSAVTCPLAAIRLVSEKEFSKFSKYLNRDKAERVKQEEEEKMRKEAEAKRRRMEEEERPSKKSWVQARLRVRIVDKKYASGRFYKEKVVVKKVLPTTCLCRADDGQILEDVRLDALETVIPRHDGGRVMIVRGHYRGELGHIHSRETKRYEAVVELSKGKRRTFDYDDLCEVVQ